MSEVRTTQQEDLILVGIGMVMVMTQRTSVGTKGHFLIDIAITLMA